MKFIEPDRIKIITNGTIAKIHKFLWSQLNSLELADVDKMDIIFIGRPHPPPPLHIVERGSGGEDY
jgi:hypothetical protein